MRSAVHRQNGRIRSQMVELEASGSISAALNLSVNYAFNHTGVLATDLEAQKVRWLLTQNGDMIWDF